MLPPRACMHLYGVLNGHSWVIEYVSLFQGSPLGLTVSAGKKKQKNIIYFHNLLECCKSYVKRVLQYVTERKKIKKFNFSCRARAVR
jgi:hypothetical protein